MFNFNSSEIKVNLDTIKRVYQNVKDLNDTLNRNTLFIELGASLSTILIIFIVVSFFLRIKYGCKITKIFDLVVFFLQNKQKEDLPVELSSTKVSDPSSCANSSSETDANINNQNHAVINKATWRCEICPYESKSSASFNHHKSLHFKGQDRNYKCFYCNFYVNNKGCLTQHEKLHKP